MSPKVIISFFIIIFLSVFSTPLRSQTTIEQKLVVTNNDHVSGGNFDVAIQLKGTNLPAANTIGTITIDVLYDDSKIDYVGATAGVILPSQGYNIFAQENTGYIRFGVTSGSVGPGTFEEDGYDITSSYETFITLNFLILVESCGVDLTIDPTTNQIGLFTTHANSDGSGDIDNQTLSSPINITDACLPIELISFSAGVQGNKVLLNWSTATEVNNYGFDIERRFESAKSNWEKIGSVPGSGNSNSPKAYSFTDNYTLASGKYSYRLKQIDIDGSFNYSNEIFAEISKPVSYSLNQNFPNPFNPETKISFSIKDAGNVNLTIYNVLGEEVRTILNEFKEAGSYTLNFNAAGLNSGVYFYRLQANNYSEIKKMIVLK